MLIGMHKILIHGHKLLRGQFFFISRAPEKNDKLKWYSYNSVSALKPGALNNVLYHFAPLQ